MKSAGAILAAAVLFTAACNNATDKTEASSQTIKAGIMKTDWGEADGQRVSLLRLPMQKVLK